ncbi:RecQ family ATP-dependent DNA helicase [Aquibacillus rhizosphaerae]|uniref:ATP-dependent DNA helicase RecQ n=1 Tax=Aquibacillus rhizosphaerae TaxID=3051431 RepID=A0ABT7L4H5_9BACI|nr:ATP-dependent DNA helicase RecQ [Aquibacillus sp. LR5S19]MDL4840768.1 ATP-dependent DNA helicase RecQ [Aquibacillus sp. LR5S19]
MNDKLESYMKEYMGHPTFRTGQKEIINDILKGKSVLGILPTGSGKSLCYQLPARILDGVVVVVSPLISLMIDQVKQLKASGFKQVIAINSFLDYSQKHQAYQQIDKYKLIYASPEMLQNSQFMKQLSRLKVALFVIDEAHCISQWGHEFRPDYLKLDTVITKLKNPPVLALSATATPEVQKDIIFQLKCPSMNKHIYPMDRDNIAFVVQHVENENKKVALLKEVLQEFSIPTMIYFSSRKSAEQVAELLRIDLPNRNIAFYHGGMDQTDRILIQQQFMNEQLDIICCTSAFGMGINKKNVRLVVHFHLPTQIESFIQEVGRAGRDGESSVSLVLATPNEDVLPRRLIETELPAIEQVGLLVDYVIFLSQEKGITLIDEDDMQLRFQLSKTQWRFLKYHFENHGMIKESRILTKVYAEWKSVLKNVQRVISQRNELKLEKLSQLLDWLNSNKCRRIQLFAPFQYSVSPPKYMCCDRCDFSFTKWNPRLVESKNSSGNWVDELKLLLLQGDENEKQTS